MVGTSKYNFYLFCMHAQLAYFKATEKTSVHAHRRKDKIWQTISNLNHVTTGTTKSGGEWSQIDQKNSNALDDA